MKQHEMRGEGCGWREESGKNGMVDRRLARWTGELHDGTKTFANLYPFSATRTAL